MPYSITEALAEIKQIDAKITKKCDTMLEFVARQDGVKDPMIKEGGSAAFCEATMQSINDLAKRKVQLRVAINKANLATPLTLEGVSQSIAEWIIWRREVAPMMSGVINSIAQRLTGWRKEAQSKNWATIKAGEEGKAQTDVVVNFDEAKLLRDGETLQNILGTLDGKLSLHNATTVMEV